MVCWQIELDLKGLPARDATSAGFCGASKSLWAARECPAFGDKDELGRLWVWADDASSSRVTNEATSCGTLPLAKSVACLVRVVLRPEALQPASAALQTLQEIPCLCWIWRAKVGFCQTLARTVLDDFQYLVTYMSIFLLPQKVVSGSVWPDSAEW